MELEQERLRKHKSSIWALVVVSAVLLALTSSIFNGYAAIKPVLINEGLYSNLCKTTHHSQNISCPSRALALNRMFQSAIAGNRLFALPIGYFLDRAGRQATAYMSTFIWCCAVGFFGLFVDPALTTRLQEVMLPIINVVMAVSGAGFLFVCTKYIADMRKISIYEAGIINAILQAANEASAGVYYLFYQLYFHTKIGVLQIFVFYAGILFAPLLIWSSYVTAPFQHSAAFEVFRLRTKPRAETPSIWDVIFSSKVIVLWIAEGAVGLQGYFYMSTLLEQLYWITSSHKEAELLNYYFSIMMPLMSVVCSFLMAFALTVESRTSVSRSLSEHTSLLARNMNASSSEASGNVNLPLQYEPISPAASGDANNVRRIESQSSLRTESRSSWKMWLAVLFLSASWGILSVVRISWVQYITFLVFIGWRVLSGIALYQYVAEHFPRAQFSTVSSSALTVSGVCLFATYGLNSLVETTLKGDYLLVNVSLAVVSTATCVSLTIVAYKSRTAIVL